MRPKLRFPSISARDLQGVDVDLPEAFTGERNVVLIAFRRQHQDLVDSWVPWLERQAATDLGLRIYELPTIGRIWAPVRNLIDGGMAASIREPAVLQRTFTIYGDVRRVTAPLGIGSTSTIALRLVDASGAVLWVGEGGFDVKVARSLKRKLGQS